MTDHICPSDAMCRICKSIPISVLHYANGRPIASAMPEGICDCGAELVDWECPKCDTEEMKAERRLQYLVERELRFQVDAVRAAKNRRAA